MHQKILPASLFVGFDQWGPHRLRHLTGLARPFLALLLAFALVWSSARAEEVTAETPAPDIVADITPDSGAMPTMPTTDLPADFSFGIYRKKRQIGTHYIRFEREGDIIHVGIDINIKVKIGPITAYHYAHRNDERWQGNKLLSIETTTNDNGQKYHVVGTRTDEGFKVTGMDGEMVLPDDVVPTSYWNPIILQASLLLDSQRGIARKVDIAERGTGECGVKYDMRGEMNLDLWYDQNQRWCALVFENGGTRIYYKKLEN